MKQIVLILSLLIFSPLSLQAQTEEVSQPCLTIYAADSAFYQKALESEKIQPGWTIFSMELLRTGLKAKMIVTGYDYETETKSVVIDLKQNCGGEVVED